MSSTIQKVVRAKYAAKIGNDHFGINGAQYFYGNRTIAGIIGMKEASKVSGKIDYKDSKRKLVRLVAVCEKGQGSRKKVHRIGFYCDPSETEKALRNLPGKKVSRPRDTNYEIKNVYRPLKRVFQD